MEYHGDVLMANSDLYHHGILGQKWGRRNGPPYPLNMDAHSVLERKAGWKKSLKSGAKKVAKASGEMAVKGAKKAASLTAKGVKKAAAVGADVARGSAGKYVERKKAQAQRRADIREYYRIQNDLYKDELYRRKLDNKFNEKHPNLKTADQSKMIPRTNSDNKSKLKEVAKFAGESVLTGGPMIPAARRLAAKNLFKANPNATTAQQRHIMSDQELDSYLNRVRKENELRRLENENVDAGRAFMTSTGQDIARTVTKTAITGAALYAGKAIISGQFSNIELGNAIFKGGAGKK